MLYGTAGFIPGQGAGSSLDGMPNTNGQEHERQWRFTNDIVDFMNAGKTNAEGFGGRSGFEMQRGESIASPWGGPLHGAATYSTSGSFEQKAPFSEYRGQGLLNFRTPHSGSNWNFNAPTFHDLPSMQVGSPLQAGNTGSLANALFGGGGAGVFGDNGRVGSSALSGQSQEYGFGRGSTQDEVHGGIAQKGSESLFPNSWQGVWDRFRQLAFKGLGQDSSSSASKESAPVAKESPSPRGTTLITTYDDYGINIGSHSALYIPGKGILYDPSGSYGGATRPTGDTFYDDQANLDKYITYQEASGSKVYLTTIPTTPSQEDAIAARVGKLGGRGSCACASSVSEALGGVCESPLLPWPGFLHDKAEKAAHAK